MSASVDDREQLGRILVVEDERIVALDLVATLGDLGYVVIGSVSTGEDAVVCAQQNAPDVVLMDIRLAGTLDGIHAAQRIREVRDIPIIFLTAHADDDTLRRAKSAEPFGYLVKPFRAAELRCAIEIAMHRHDIDRRLREREHWLATRMTELAPSTAAPADVSIEDTPVEARIAELEATNRELEAFSASVAHDLRAPLRHIDGFSQILIEDHAANLGPDGRALLQRVRRGASHMKQLLEDLLRLSRVTSAALDRHRVDVSAMSHAVIEGLQIASPGHQPGVSIASDLAVDADPGMLQIALENLLGNAWKFTARTPGALISVGMQYDSASRALFIRDNGAGFDAQQATRLFNAFQRYHAASEFEGNGVGLAIVERIVRRHGGRIWADSRPGAGATFYVVMQQ
jgi:signal transduction histidine kinase